MTMRNIISIHYTIIARFFSMGLPQGEGNRRTTEALKENVFSMGLPQGEGNRRTTEALKENVFSMGLPQGEGNRRTTEALKENVFSMGLPQGEGNRRTTEALKENVQAAIGGTTPNVLQAVTQSVVLRARQVRVADGIPLKDIIFHK